MKYYQRLIEKEMERKLNSSGCVLVSGPKFCGKTTTCSRYVKSITSLKDTNSILLANADPKGALIGDKPHLIDEWQKAPEIWNIIKNDLDEDYEFGKYIITGSTTPVDKSKIQHSGAGRFSFLVLRPLSLFESEESLGIVSLKELFSKNVDASNTLYYQNNKISLEDIAFFVCRGGWPIALKAKKEYAIDVTRNYYEGLFNEENESDEFSEFLKNKNIDLLKLILKSYARNISTQSKKTKMIKDIIDSGEVGTLDENTFAKYKRILEDLFIIFEFPAWNLNLRTSVSVSTTPTHHFFDTSIATAALGIGPSDLMDDLKSFGYFFKDLAIKDLIVYSSSISGSLKHYRDSKGKEVDAIIELPDGQYGAIEIKIASEKNIQEGIDSLFSFEKQMERNGLKTPTFKMILTSHGSCYLSKEGVNVVPINCLRP